MALHQRKFVKLCYAFAALCGISACSSTTPLPDSNERLNAVLWMQGSAEYHALSLNTYAQATNAIVPALADKTWSAALEQIGNYSTFPTAIIVDIDETILDNLPFQAQLIKDRKTFNQKDWEQWTQRASAAPLPGAKAFLDAAHAQGVTIFYVTNREATQEQDTRTNLRNQQLPLRTDIDVVLMKNENGWTSSDKSSRRTHIIKNFRVIALVGDDFGDFSSGAKSSPQDRVALAQTYESLWGKKWFLLPNPVYGSWEAALHNHDYSVPAAKVTELKLNQLKTIE